MAGLGVQPQATPALTTLAALKPFSRRIGVWGGAWPPTRVGSALRRCLTPTSQSQDQGIGCTTDCLSALLLLASASPPHPQSCFAGCREGALLPVDRPKAAGRGHASATVCLPPPVSGALSSAPAIYSPGLPGPSLSKIGRTGSRSRRVEGAGGLVYLTLC